MTAVSESTLFCTVGGSHQPIVTAIKTLRPKRVVFFCTGTDPATGKAGSRQQVEGKGMIIKAAPQDDKPTLPNIPAQCGLPDGSWEVVEVPADDLDAAYGVMRQALAQAGRDEGARLVADYTGGTKTMTAALVLAALDAGNVQLQSVTGARADLIKVRDGTQAAVPTAVEGIRFRHDIHAPLAAWRRYAWDQAADGLTDMTPPQNATLRAFWQRARDVSEAFAAWDRFDHVAALERLSLYEGLVARTLPAHYLALKMLARGKDAAAEGLRIWDLWLNAQRRAADGRYDDAVARVYRLIEWTAQWQLRTKRGWETGNLPREVAVASGIAPNRDGSYQVGLYPAWQLAAAHCGNPLAGFFEDSRLALLDHLRRRNDSILAHGTVPVSKACWQSWAEWLTDKFEPLLKQLLAEVRINDPFPQLPNAYPWLEDLMPWTARTYTSA